MNRIILTAALVAFASGVKADEARLLRFPSVNGDQIVFSYAGDLYSVPVTGGDAKRLTSHQGYEIFPRISPDGKHIAFTGQYDGNTEVYLIPTKGGEPQRLTFTSTNSRDDLGDRMGPNNMVLAWSPEGEIVYRNRIGSSFQGQLWKIGEEGGMPTQIPLPEGGFCSFSPDGKKMAYNRVMREFRTWKYYRGGMADDIWIYDPEAGSVENITSNIAQDIIPMWIGDDIYFISDRDNTMNLFAYNTKDKTTRKVTDYSDYDIKFPSTDGKTIVFEKGGYLYHFNPAKGTPEKISVNLTSDNTAARNELKNVGNKITAWSLSPGGHRLAVTARGEVFDVPVGKGVTRDITRTPGSNDRNAQWSPDGRWIAYIGDVTGETEIYLQNPQGGDPVQLTKDNDTYIRNFEFTPDSRQIIYSDRKNRLVAVDIATKNKKVLQQNPEGEFRGYVVSPDSKWIAYTKSGSNDISVIYMMNLTTGKEYAVTDKWSNSGSPLFSADGKYLYFSSDRDFEPIYGSLEWNHVYTRMGGLYVALLSADEPSPALLSDDADPVRGGANVSDLKGKGKRSGAPTLNTTSGASQSGSVSYDPEGIENRIIKISLQAGYYRPLYGEGNKVWYADGRDVMVYNFSEGKSDVVAEGASMEVAADGEKAAFYQRGRFYVTDFPTQKANLSDPVDLSRLVAEIDYAQEWNQIYDEVWRAFRDGFYLENMHGADWNAIKAKYAELLPYVKTRYDLNYVIGEMISELACGHAYVNPGEVKGIDRISMGLLGAELSRDKSGYFKIEKIIPGAVYSKDLRSPLEEPGLGVKEGDFIIAIDGVPVTETTNIYSLLVGKADVPVELTVNTSAKEQGARKIVIEPISDESALRHYNWVQNNIKRVEEASGGKVGYIYIPDMGVEGLNEFSRYFYPQLDKEALIIDDRANGGGNVSPMIIERLLRTPYRMTMSRTSTKTGTIPDATHVGPKVLLINKYSASDGDLFPWSFKANNLGTVIGTRTWGGIIGISGSLPYMDGTDVRVPFFTNYDAKTGQWIVENHGVDPDILIDNDPIKEQAGIDQQLEKAIEVALEQLKDRKPLPGVPAPRTFKDLGVNK